MTDDEIKQFIIQEVIKQLTSEIYSDALKPGVTEVGRILKTLVEVGSTVLTPISLLNERARHLRERNSQKLRAKLEEIPPEKLSEIHSEIGVPVLKKLEYTQNEDLVDLFVNLLASAANIDTAHLAHPSFVNIISNLSPDEAKILKFLFENDLQMCSMHIRATAEQKYFDFNLQTTIFHFNSVPEFSENMRAYISNLKGLGLLIDAGIPYSDPQYNDIQNHLRGEKETLEKDSQYTRVFFVKGCFSLSEFGKLFVRCCTRASNS